MDVSSVNVVHKFGENNFFDKGDGVEAKEENTTVKILREEVQLNPDRVPEGWDKKMHSTYDIIGTVDAGVKTKR